MSTLTPPKANIPIGIVMVGGKAVPALIHPEWLRYLSRDLFGRSGGATGESTNDLLNAAFEDAGIDDSKVAIERLEDEQRTAPLPVAVVIDSADNLANLIAELDTLRRRIEALEVA